MRAVLSAAAVLLLAPLAACGDATGTGRIILTDTVTLASVTGPSTLETALDITTANSTVRPENPLQAGQWDLLARQSGSVFTLSPNPGNGYRGAGLQKTTRSFESPGSAPRSASSYTRTDVPVAVGDVYYLQSRQASAICGIPPKYGIVKVVATVPDSGLIRLAVTSNQQCDDERLTP